MFILFLESSRTLQNGERPTMAVAQPVASIQEDSSGGGALFGQEKLLF